MAANPRILCTICARGGSKGIPGKNVREVGGKPLIAHTIEHALEWERADDVVVSTDDSEIAEIAQSHGASVPFVRPERLATDTAAKLPVIQHAHERMAESTGTEYDYVVDLDATAPLRTVADIERTFEAVHETDAQNAYSVAEAEKNPYFNMVELDEDGYAHLSKRPDEEIDRRQDAPPVYKINASIYVYDVEFLLDPLSQTARVPRQLFTVR